jgi:CO dehydrogenase maturation factor
MKKTIAIAGKGGTGKTTISALILFWLIEHVSASILVVDADSNVNLNDLLGVKIQATVGNIREEMLAKINNLPAGMTKQQFLEYKVQSSLAEYPDFDLLAMGRPEGPGCYCYANNLLRDILNSLKSNYDFILIDNEAGMEHLSRRTTGSIDCLLLISDPSIRGIQTAVRISTLLKELDTRVKDKFLILNRNQVPVSKAAKKLIKESGLTLLGSLPEDRVLLEADRNNTPLKNILSSSSAFNALGQIMKKIINSKNIKEVT